jgi:hypothetical protein
VNTAIDQVEIRWIKLGIAGGLCASVLYPVLLFAPLPLVLTAAVASLLGPAIGVGSLGLYRLIRLHAPSVMAALGAIHNVVAGALFTAMALVQLAVRARPAEGAAPLTGVWLGLDVAWTFTSVSARWHSGGPCGGIPVSGGRSPLPASLSAFS